MIVKEASKCLPFGFRYKILIVFLKKRLVVIWL